MQRPARKLVVGLVLLAVSGALVLSPAHAVQTPEHKRVSLTPAWTTGIISDGAGRSNILVDDLDQDGLTDIVSCSNGAVYVVNWVDATYDVARYSEGLACAKIAAGDRDGNGLQEIYVAGALSGLPVPGPQPTQIPIHILRSDTLEQIDEFAVPIKPSVADLAVGDVDGDGDQEIVVVQGQATYVHDAYTFALEWAATDKGGSRVGLGDVDGDADVEIVVNGSIAHILNARLQQEEFTYTGGFGQDMAVGDVDADAIDEIAGLTGTGVYIFEADTGVNKWFVDNYQDVDRVAVDDMNGDGIAEVVTGNGQGGSLIGYAGNDGSQLWTIVNPEYAVDGLGLGDADNDGVPEVVWGAGYDSTGRDALLVGDWQSESVEWNSDDLDGLIAPVAADIDLDGQVEIILASVSTDSGYEGGMIRVYDGASHKVEWSLTIGEEFETPRIYAMDVGQVDADPALEIVLGCTTSYHTKIYVYDGITHFLEWKSDALASYGSLQVIVGDVDDTQAEEIVIALPDQRVQAWNAVTSTKVWDSEMLSGPIQDMDIWNLNGDSTLELAILTSATLYVFETGTWNLDTYLPFPNAQSIALANGDLTSPGDVLLLTGDSDTGWTLHALDGIDYSTLWEWPFVARGRARVRAMEMDGDGDEEFVLLAGDSAPYSTEPSLLLIGSYSGTSVWVEYQTDRNWGAIEDALIIDVDNDAEPELLFGTYRCIHVDEITSSPLIINLYLPTVWH